MLLSAIYPTNFRRESRVLNTNTTYFAQSTTFSKTFATPAQDTLSLSSANIKTPKVFSSFKVLA